MLNYILDDWMPWYKHCHDFSLLEVNRLENRVTRNTTGSSKAVHSIKLYVTLRHSCNMPGLDIISLCAFELLTQLLFRPLITPYRSVNGKGFSRETTTALIANIESTEWVRRQRVNSNLNPEHPRASTTDDVECFFSVMRDTVGKSLL